VTGRTGLAAQEIDSAPPVAGRTLLIN